LYGLALANSEHTAEGILKLSGLLDYMLYECNVPQISLEKEVKRIKRAKVTVQQDIYHVEGYGLIATFVDPDGNFFQLVQVRAAN